jgi:hypothetical protein
MPRCLLQIDAAATLSAVHLITGAPLDANWRDANVSACCQSVRKGSGKKINRLLIVAKEVHH